MELYKRSNKTPLATEFLIAWQPALQYSCSIKKHCINFKFKAMKKIFTCGFLFAVCLSFFTSCAKDVKAPAKRTSNTTAKTYTPPTTTTETSNQNQGTHTCGGGGGYNGSGH